LAAPVSHAALRVSIAGRKTTVPMVVAGTHCAPFHRMRTPTRKLLCRIHAACARLGEANFGCARPGQAADPRRAGSTHRPRAQRHGDETKRNVSISARESRLAPGRITPNSLMPL